MGLFADPRTSRHASMSSLFRPAIDLLTDYAERHRDRRNIVTHVVGLPLIVLAMSLLLARPALEVAGWPTTPAWLVYALAASWILTRGAPALGVATTLAIGVLVALAQGAASGAGMAAWLGWGAGLLVAGSSLLLLGHYYEGRQPAFGADPAGVLAGPMFVVLELLGSHRPWRRLHDEVERRAGPPTIRDLAAPLAR